MRKSPPDSNTGRLVRNSVVALVMMLFYALVTGCAGTAKGLDNSVYSNLQPEPVTSQQESKAPALVIIRYPAMIHAHAENYYVSSFAINAIGGEVPFSEYGKPQTSRVAQSVIEKSSYFAMSLYRELKEVLPEGSVLLSPHIVVWDKQKKLHTRPILATEQIPSVLTIDFNIYSFPDVNQLMDSPPITFGDLVTPMIVVKSSRWAQPSLNGLLVSSPPLVSTAWRQARANSKQHFQSRMDGDADNIDAPLDFISFLGERDSATLQLPVKRTGHGNLHNIAIEEYPLEKIRMDGAVIAGLGENFSIDPFENSFVRGASTRIVEILNSIDHERATFFARQEAVTRFDPELANVFFVQSADESVRARLQLAEALVGAEREFLAAQSDSIYDGTYLGNYGMKMRKIIAAEYRMLEERRSLARKQNITTAVAVIALAGTVYGAIASTAATAVVVAGSGAALVGSAWAAHKSLGIQTESDEVHRYFLARMAPVFDRQMAVQMEWLESKELITARSFAEFRNKTLSLYQSRVRSMSISAKQRCEFSHPDFDGIGRWYGVCDNDKGTGRGYGLVSNHRGDQLEYIGYAMEGRASGSGGMIIQRAGNVGLTYYEGSFKNGVPDGVVKVEKPGQPTKFRTFKAGVDVGRADPRSMQRLSFSAHSVQTRTLNP